METVVQWFLYFIAYSALGYLAEIFFCAIHDRKLQNRGFLFGPICPIYGYGAILFLLCYQWLQWPWWATFFMIIILCDTLEYLTSFAMEKIFRVRWWDYREETKLTINGRISLYTSLLFGIGGLIVVYIIHPVLVFLVGLLPPIATISLAIILFIVMVADTIFSAIAALAIKGELVKGIKIDLTPEIKKFVRDYYRKHNRVERKVQRKTKRAIKKQTKRG